MRFVDRDTPLITDFVREAIGRREKVPIRRVKNLP